MLTALIAAGQMDEAARLADDALARGDQGPMGSTVDVLKYLSAFAKGPEAYREFRASLEPTHFLDVIFENEKHRTIAYDLIRAHHPGRLASHLADLNGSDPWAVVLTDLRESEPGPEGELLYLQAAGTAECMVVEVCRRGGAEVGAVSVRSVIGRVDAVANDGQDIAITLPKSVEWISPHEAFTADEVASLFESFYQRGEFDRPVALRPVEGYRSDGGYVDLSGADRTIVR